MAPSARLAADRLNFRDSEANALLQLVVDQGTRGHAQFQTTNGSNGTQVSITGIAVPTADDGIASKAYVDSVASGLDMKGQVDYICIGPLMPEGGGETYYYDSTAKIFTITGVGAWDALTTAQIDIEHDGDGDPQTIAEADIGGWFGSHVEFVAAPLEHYYEATQGDTATATTNFGIRRDWPTRVLLNAERNPKHNGIYWLKDDGSSGNWQLQRTMNFDGNPNGEVKAGGFVFVADGYKYANKGFVLIQDATNPTPGGFTLTTDGTDGNDIMFDGFSAAGFPHKGANIEITGDTIATSMTPTFTNVTAGVIQIASAGDNTITCTSAVHFANTGLIVGGLLRCTNTVSALALEVKASGETATVKFSVSANGLTDIAGTTYVRGDHLYLDEADFVIQHGSPVLNQFTVLHESGNTDIQGTLDVDKDVQLALSNGKAMIHLQNAHGTTTHPTMNVYGHIKVLKANNDVLLDIAMLTGNTTFTGTVAVKNRFSVQNSTGTTEKASISSAEGNAMFKGNLQCFAQSATAKASFIVDAAQAGDLSSNLLTYTNDLDLDIRNSAEATIVKIHPGTSPKMQIYQSSLFEMYNGGSTKTVTINGATGETKLIGASANFSVGVMNSSTYTQTFTVSSATGNTTCDGTLTLRGNQTITEGNLTVTLGEIRVGTSTKARMIVHKPSDENDHICAFRGDGSFEIQSDDGTQRFCITGNTGDTALKKGAKLTLENGSDAVHWEVDVTDGTILYGGNFKVKDSIKSNSSIDKFTVEASSGNTVIQGTSMLHGEVQCHTGLFETSCDFRVSLDADDTAHVFANLTKFYEMTATTTTFRTGNYEHNYKSEDDVIRYQLKLAGDNMIQKFTCGKMLMISAGNVPYTVFEVDATPTASMSPTAATMKVCADIELVGTDGVNMMEIDTTTGNIMTRGSFIMKSGATASLVAKTTINADGSAIFNGTHTIYGNTTIKTSSNLTMETGIFKMIGTGGTAANPKYSVDASGGTKQLGTLTIYSGTPEDGSNVFVVNLSGNVTASGTISAASGAFTVVGGGNTTTGGTLDVGSTSIMRGSLSFIAPNDAGVDATFCSIGVDGSIDTLGTLDVDGLATFSAPSSNNAVIVESGDVKFKYDSVNTAGGPHYKVSFDDTRLMTLMYPGQSMALQESSVSGACIEMTTANSTAATPTVPSLVMHKGASLTVKESATSNFFVVDATARTVKMGSAQTSYLQTTDGTSVQFQVNMGTGELKSQGSIEVYEPFDNDWDGNVPKFSVDSANGNTVVKGTLSVTNKLTVSTGNVEITAGKLDIQNERFMVPISASNANLASFKGDQAIVVMDSSSVSKWQVTGSTGSVIMYDSANLVLRSAQTETTKTLTLFGLTGSVTMAATGTLNIGSDNFKVTGGNGNVLSKGTMEVQKKVSLTTANGGMEIASGNLEVYAIGTSYHKFSVSSSVLGKFVQPNGSNNFLSVVYENDDSTTTTKFSVSGQHGDTSIFGGNFTVTTSDPSKALFRVHQTNAASVRIMGISSTTSFVIRNQLDTEDKFSVVANTGALAHVGTFTHSGGTMNCNSKFEIGSATDSRSFVINYEDDDADTDIAKFIKIFADSNHVVLGGTDGVLKMTIGTSSGVMKTVGDLVLRNQLGVAGVDKCKITASTGTIDTAGNITMNASGVFKIENNSTQPAVTKFQVTGSSGAVATQGSITVATNKWVVNSSGDTIQRGKFEVGDGTNSAKFQVLYSNGNTTICGGSFEVMNSAGTISLFKVCQADEQDVNGKIEYAGNLEMDGSLSVGTSNTNAAFLVESDGDTTLRGGDILQYDSGGNLKFELRAGTGLLKTYGEMTVGGALTGHAGAVFTGNIGAANMLVTSDERLKHRISEISGKQAIEMCTQMQGYHFEWRNVAKHGGGKQFGFLAQKIKDVHPALVHMNDDGYYKVNYDIVSALSTTAISNLQEQVKELKEEIAELRGTKDEVAQLKAEMAELKALVMHGSPKTDSSTTHSSTTRAEDSTSSPKASDASDAPTENAEVSLCTMA